jgi:hypothetical protein
MAIKQTYTDNKITASVDYTQKKVFYSAMLSGDVPVGSAFRMVNSKGHVICSDTAPVSMGPIFDHYKIHGSGEFGVTFDSDGLPLYEMADISGLYHSNGFTEIDLSGEYPGLGLLEYTTPAFPSGNSSEVDNFQGVPLYVERGDACLHATITGVISGNLLALQIPSDVALNSTGELYHNSLITVLSGSASGQQFHVKDQIFTSNLTGLYVDRHSNDLSGQIIQVAPRRLVTDYSGWHDPYNYRVRS